MFSRTFVAFVLLATVSFAAPTSSLTATTTTSTQTASEVASAPPAWETVPPASQDPNEPIFPDDATDVANPQPVRGSLGGSILGPVNVPIALQNPDLLAPPTTDHGDIPNAKWPFSFSANRIQTGGWARQQNTDDMPLAKKMASVNMRLEPGAIRELHWHTSAEWAYVLKGTTQVTSVDQDGRNFVANVGPGDLWYFPPGIPHSLQATADEDGSEFLLVFDQGDFNENDTFLLTDWLAHVPMEVLAKNFQTDIATFAHIPSEQLYIFPSEPPTSDSPVSDPQGQVPSPFYFPLSKMNAMQFSGGTAKIVDSTTFKVSTAIALGDITVEPGAMRELHWHPTQDEWTFFMEGQARVTLFAASSNARTFDFQAGDIGYVPAAYGHYVENIGNTTLHYLEIFNTDRFEDISLSQWLALTPPALVKAHLGFDDATIANLSKSKAIVVGPAH